MAFVQRDKSGKIIGVFAHPQPQEDGTSLTDAVPLPDDHPEVVAFLKPQTVAPDSAAAFVSRQRDAALDALDAAISALPAGQQNAFRLIQQLLKD